MAFFGDFPHVSNFDSDLTQIICYYNTLVNKYTELNNSYNELVEKVNDSYDYIDKEIKDKTDAVIAQVNNDLSTIRTEMDDLNSNINVALNDNIDYVDNSVEKIENELAQTKNDINNKLSENEQEINNIKNEISTQLQNTLLSIDSKIATLETTLYNEINILNTTLTNEIDNIKKQIEDIEANYIPVYNPVSGKVEPIEKTIYDVYEGLRSCAYTCIQHDSSGYSCDEISVWNLTCTEYDNMLCHYMVHTYLYNPVTGEIMSHNNWNQRQNVFGFTIMSGPLNPNAGQQLTPLSCDQQKVHDMTAEQWDALNLTASDYSFWLGSALAI